jgi:type IV pilus assembly protein PilM
LKLSLFSQPSVVGLDIQSDGIRLIQLKKSKHQYHLEQLAISKLPAGLFMEGKIKQWDLLLSALSELVLQLDIKNQLTALSLSANLVRMQHIQMPAGMQEIHIETEIEAQVARDFPSMTEALCLDFVEKPHKREGYSDIFFIVARQEYLRQYLHCVNAAGLKVKMVDIDIYAMTRAVSQGLTPTINTNEAQAFLHVVNNVASFIIFNDQDILFYQQWDIIDVTDFHSRLKSQIKIFFSTFAHVTIQRLAVCAEYSHLNWITEELCAPWGWKIYYPDPFAGMNCEWVNDIHLLKKNRVDFMVACGLAMREVPLW